MNESLEILARRLGSRITQLSRGVALAAQVRQGTVLAYRAGPPRVMDVTADGGQILDVPLLTHHAAPAVSDTVWIVRVVGGGWLYHGKQG